MNKLTDIWNRPGVTDPLNLLGWLPSDEVHDAGGTYEAQPHLGLRPVPRKGPAGAPRRKTKKQKEREAAKAAKEHRP